MVIPLLFAIYVVRLSTVEAFDSAARPDDFSHPTYARHFDRDGVIVCALWASEASVRDLRLCHWTDNADVFSFDFRVPRYIDGPGTDSRWLIFGQLKSPKGNDHGPHEPVVTIGLIGENGRQGAFVYDPIRRRSSGDIWFDVGSWNTVTIAAETHRTDGHYAIFINGRLMLRAEGKTGFLREAWPVWCIGNYGRYGRGDRWHEIEFRSVSLR